MGRGEQQRHIALDTRDAESFSDHPNLSLPAFSHKHLKCAAPVRLKGVPMRRLRHDVNVLVSIPLIYARGWENERSGIIRITESRF